MCKLFVISLLVLCAEIHSLDVQNDQQVPVQKEQKINEQNVKVGDTIPPDEKASINPNPNSKPPEEAKKPAPKVTAEQIQVLADQVLSIHGVKPGEDDPDNLKRAAHLTKVVENAVKNLEDKVKEKKINDSLKAGVKNENLATEPIGENKVEVTREDVPIIKEPEVKPNSDNVVKATVDNKNAESNVKLAEPTKDEIENKKTEEKQNVKGSKEENIEDVEKEILKKTEEEQKLKENINEEIIKNDIKQKTDAEENEKKNKIEEVKEEISETNNLEDKDEKGNVYEEVVVVKLEELEDDIEDGDAEEDAEKIVIVEYTKQENKDDDGEKLRHDDEDGYFTIFVNFVYDTFLRN